MRILTEIDSFLCTPDLPVRDVLARINNSTHLFQLVVDPQGRLLGTVTDGDVRRALLKGSGLEAPVRTIMFDQPNCGLLSEDSANRIKLMQQRTLLPFLPLVDVSGIVRAILVGDPHETGINRALVMAGGFGSRMREHTAATPKPLLLVNGKPILEHVLLRLEDAGMAQIHVSVHYLADQIEAYLSGRPNRAAIHILKEEAKLGTAGALGLLGEAHGEGLIVVNGDLVTRADFQALELFHRRHALDGTIAAARYQVSVPYGVIRHGEDGTFQGIDEKPTLSHFVAAGIYCLSNAVCTLVAPGQPRDMPDLLNEARAIGLKIGIFPVHEYWRDVGRPDDLKAANSENETA